METIFDDLRALADKHSDTRSSSVVLEASIQGNALIAALEGIFAQTAKHSRQWGQAESARQFASDPDTAKAFNAARAVLAQCR